MLAAFESCFEYAAFQLVPVYSHFNLWFFRRSYHGLPWVCLSADTWTSRIGKGFLAVEITVLVFNVATGEIRLVSICLDCVYCPGSHTGKALAAIIKAILASFGIDIAHVRVYVSDSGGGIPMVAKILKLIRDACFLHSYDTVQNTSPPPASTRVDHILVTL